MLESILSGAAAGGMQFLSGLTSSIFQDKANKENAALQREINASNLAHADKWNTLNYELAREAQDAQLAQQQWSNEQYIESRDYDRAMQQEIFNREDTAIQRAVDDATSAGFSPLAALGMPAGAGQVVGSSGSPGSMVSNNQAAVQSAGQVSPHLEAITGLSGSLSSIGTMIATMSENMSNRQHQTEMQKADILSQYKKIGLEGAYEWLLQDSQQNFLNDQRIASHLDNLSVIADTAKFNMALERLRQEGSKDLQDDAQEHELQMQANQQEFEADYRVKTASAAYEDMLSLGKEYLVPVVRSFSPDLADWLESNSFGSDFLVQIVSSVQSTAPLVEGIGNAMESASDGAWSMNPLSKLGIFGGSKPKK